MLYTSLKDVQYKELCNQKDDNELVTGEAARDFLKKKTENHLCNSRLIDFYVNVRKYFIIITDYYMVKLPFDDPYLIAAEVTNPDHQTSTSTESLRYFVHKFSALILPSATVDSIIEQFTLYQSTDMRD